MAEEEISVDQLRYMQNVYSQEYEVIMGNLNNYVNAAGMITRNIEFIDNLDKVKDKNMLLSLEAGTYIEVKTGSTDTVFTYIGFGYVAEKSKEEAKAFLGENRKRTDGVIKKLSSDRERIETELVKIELKLNSMQHREE